MNSHLGAPPAREADDRPRAQAVGSTPRRVLRATGRGAAALMLAGLVTVGCVLTVLRAVPGLQEWPGAGLVVSFAAYGLIVWSLAAILALAAFRGRSRVIASSAALALAGVHTAWIAPYYLADDRPLTGTPVTIFSMNVLGGATDPDGLMRAAEDADVVVLLEFDASTEAALMQRGWAQHFPYHIGGAGALAEGSIVFARRPLALLTSLPTQFGAFLVEVDAGRPDAFGLLAGHPVNPPIGRVAWLREAQLVGQTARFYIGKRLVVIGDLNSTPDHVTIRRMRADAGLRDAADEAGAGWLRTYPANRAYLPPVLGLDQALLRGQVFAESVKTVRVPGSDHLGIRVALRLG